MLRSTLDVHLRFLSDVMMTQISTNSSYRMGEFHGL
jgi:hypothetical protein